ncbi:MAG: hypothetical protein WD625_04055 [Balneolales bacterium]
MHSELHNPELEEQIDLYLNGALNHDEIELLWEQLIEYPEYVEYMKTCASLRHIGQEQAGGLDNDCGLAEEKVTAYNFRYAIAAGIVLLIVIISILKIISESEPSLPEPLASLELNNLRSSSVTYNEFDREIQEGINLAVLGKGSQALEVLYQLRESTTNDAQEMDVMINIGIVHYNLSDYKSAKEIFLAVTNTSHAEPLIKEKAWWYLANSYLKTNHREDAKIAAQHTYDVNGAYRRMAARWLERL